MTDHQDLIDALHEASTVAHSTDVCLYMPKEACARAAKVMAGLRGAARLLTRRLEGCKAERNRLRDENKRLREGLEALIASVDKGARVSKPGPCGMTIEANVRHTWITRIEAWALEEARAVLEHTS